MRTSATVVLVVLVVLVVPLSRTAFAEPSRDDAVNLSPLKMLLGNLAGVGGVAVTYEHVFAGGHGVVVDLGVGYSRDLQEAGETTGATETHGRLAAGYRWHARRRGDGGFVGVMLHQTVGRGHVTFDAPGGPITVDVDHRATMLSGHGGWRWRLGRRLNVTARAGLGWGPYTVIARGDRAEAADAEAEMRALLTRIPVGIDAELSLGYQF